MLIKMIVLWNTLRVKRCQFKTKSYLLMSFFLGLNLSIKIYFPLDVQDDCLLLETLHNGGQKEIHWEECSNYNQEDEENCGHFNISSILIKVKHLWPSFKSQNLENQHKSIWEVIKVRDSIINWFDLSDVVVIKWCNFSLFPYGSTHRSRIFPQKCFTRRRRSFNEATHLSINIWVHVPSYKNALIVIYWITISAELVWPALELRYSKYCAYAEYECEE